MNDIRKAIEEASNRVREVTGMVVEQYQQRELWASPSQWDFMIRRGWINSDGTLTDEGLLMMGKGVSRFFKATEIVSKPEE